MKRYTFRPYYAHDCNSDSGFNDGRYCPEITVDAADPDTARDVAMVALADQFNFGTVDKDETEQLGVDAAWVDHRTYRDANGDDATADDDDAECFYLYQYLDLGEAEEVK